MVEIDFNESYDMLFSTNIKFYAQHFIDYAFCS